MVDDLPDPLRDRLDKTPARVLIEYLAGRLGPESAERTVARAVAGEPLPIDTRTACEQLAERLQLTAGQQRLELIFEEGRLRKAYRHETLGVGALERRFDVPLLG